MTASDLSGLYPRTLRPVAEPLGLYIRAGKNDHRELLSMLSSGASTGCGVVFDPSQLKPQRELLQRVLDRRLDAILDPRTQPLATVGGHTQSLAKLNWGKPAPHSVDDFSGVSARRIVRSIAKFAVENRFTQVMAPTHLLSCLDDGWWDTDRESTLTLRSELDRDGGSDIPIIYSLAISYALFRDIEARRELARGLASLPVEAVWIELDGFGSDSTATATRTFLEGITDFHGLRKPLVSDHLGGLVGVAVLAFGGVGGIAHGVTTGERFDCSSWRRPRVSKPFGMARRIYFPELDLMLKPSEADALFALGSKAHRMFGCRDTACCPRGITDMRENRVRHFLYQRMGEVRDIEQVPESLRVANFLERRLRPTTDHLVAATRLPWTDPVFQKRIEAQRKRLDMLRVALGDLAMSEPRRSVAIRPLTRMARHIPTLPRLG